MSIIHEALKKTGQPIMTEAQKNPQENRSGFQPEYLRKKSRSNFGPFVALGVLLLIGAPVLAPLWNNASKAVNEISVGSALPASSGNLKRQFAIEEAPLPTMPNLSRAALPGRTGRYSLSGIVYSNEDSYCLINGKVMRVGDKLGEATLVRVTPNEAVLDYRGEEIVLSADTGRQ